MHAPSTRMLAIGTSALIGASTLVFAGPAAAAPAAAPAAVAPAASVSHSKLGSVAAPQIVSFHTRVNTAVATRVARARSVAYAKAKVGATYRFGASGPRVFDCSGLTSYVWARAAGKKLPHSSRAQYRATKRIAAAHRQPGDLVFFFKNGIAHVGIYVGNNQMVSAVGTGKGVRLETMGRWHQRHLTGYGRVA